MIQFKSDIKAYPYVAKGEVIRLTKKKTKPFNLCIGKKLLKRQSDALSCPHLWT